MKSNSPTGDKSSFKSSNKDWDSHHYKTTADQYFPQASFNNARFKMESEKVPLKELYSTLKGTNYKIGK